MMTEAIRLHFKNGLHIGRGAEELDKTAITYGSDALKSALYAVGLAYYPEWGENEKLFFEGFQISSAFPFCNDTLFLPKPNAITFKFADGNDLTEGKKAKKISYVASTLFTQWVKEPGSPLNLVESQVVDSVFLFHSGTAKKFLHTAVQQRVSVPAEGGGDARPYYFERTFFNEGSGLYFLIHFTNKNLRTPILHVLRLLGDTGIGTDRTVGNGQFSIDEPQLFELPTGKEGLQMALGLYLPTKEELSICNLEKSNWSLVRRGGYLAASENDSFRNLRKNSIYFFGEGSAFKSSVLLKGRYVNLQPQWDTPDMHPVWRCGMPLFINL